MKERKLEQGTIQTINNFIKDRRVRLALGTSLALGTIGVAGCEGNDGQTNTAITTTATTEAPTTTSTSLAEAPTTTSTTIEEFVGFKPAEKGSDGWSLKNPDSEVLSISLPDGFTPDSNLVIQNDLSMNTLGDLSEYKDWDKDVHEVAGYNYDENDFSGNADFKENVQGDMYAWRLFQGDRVIVPGIGELNGSEGRSVVVLVLNLQPKVIAWDNENLGQVYDRHGFTATGRIWDGEKIAETEEKLLGHWLFTQKEGHLGKSYIGVTDDPKNARETLFVTVAYRQWGNNEDGSPREQFQLLRTGIANFGK